MDGFAAAAKVLESNGRYFLRLVVLMLSVTTADTKVITSHGKTKVGTATERLCHLQQGQHRDYVADLRDALHSQAASEQGTL